jgi:hypothetical protein
MRRVEHIVEKRFLVLRDDVGRKGLGAAVGDFEAAGLVVDDVDVLVFAEGAAFTLAEEFGLHGLGFGEVARVHFGAAHAGEALVVEAVGAALFDAVLHIEEGIAAERAHGVVDDATGGLRPFVLRSAEKRSQQQK